MPYQATGYLVDLETVQGTAPNPLRILSLEITQEQYEKIKYSRDICLLAGGLEQRCQLVLDNYTEWESELLKQSQIYLLWQANRYDALQQRLTLDRRLTNLLTAFRLYLDQTDKNLSDVFGKKSSELDTIRKLRSSLYDGCFGYRFLEELRNHVQHCGLPVQIITFTSGFVDKDPKRHIQFSITPQATYETLAADREFKKSILDELKLLGGKIDLRLPIREYVSCIVRLHSEVRKTFSEILIESRIFYSLAVDKYSTIEGHPIQFPKLKFRDEDGNVLETIDLITDFLEHYDTLYKRNSNLRDISKSFVSNAI